MLALMEVTASETSVERHRQHDDSRGQVQVSGNLYWNFCVLLAAFTFLDSLGGTTSAQASDECLWPLKFPDC